MKNRFFLLSTVLLSAIAFAQDATPQQATSPTESTSEFTVNKDQQITDYVVMQVEDKTKEELYKKAVEWVNKTYNNPKEVIKAQVDNDYIRFQGIESKGYCRNPMIEICDDMRYQIEISVKDGKYKFDIVNLEAAITGKYGNITGWDEIVFKKGWMNFKSNGEVRDQYKDTMPKIARYINSLNKSLYDYILNQNDAGKQNDW